MDPEDGRGVVILENVVLFTTGLWVVLTGWAFLPQIWQVKVLRRINYGLIVFAMGLVLVNHHTNATISNRFTIIIELSQQRE
jgi:hypothetical protein